MSDRMVIVDVCRMRIHEECRPELVTNLIGRLQSICALVPEEYLSSLRIRSGALFGDVFTVYYERSETEYEARARLQFADRQETEADAKERAEYDRLRKKFEGK